MKKKSDVLKIIREDILRILAEKKGKVIIESIKDEIKASGSYISKAIKELIKRK